MAKTTIASLSRDISTEAQAYEYLEMLRWDGVPTCAHCGSAAVSFMAPENGVSRKTRTGAQSERRVWQCRACRKQFSVTTGTMMHKTRIPIRTWVMVFFEMCASKNGVAAREIERKYGLCPRSAWHMTQRIRSAMANEDGSLFSGIVEADEMYVGKRQKGRGSNMTDKLPIVTVVERGGRARSVVAADSTATTLVPLVASNIEPGTAVVTDAWKGYSDLHHFVAKHETVNHGVKEWARGIWTTNTVEGFFGQVRRSISGTHHYVTNKHVGRYMAEFDYRYSTRHQTDAERMASLMQQVEGPLPYRTLIGKA